MIGHDNAKQEPIGGEEGQNLQPHYYNRVIGTHPMDLDNRFDPKHDLPLKEKKDGK